MELEEPDLGVLNAEKRPLMSDLFLFDDLDKTES